MRCHRALGGAPSLPHAGSDARPIPNRSRRLPTNTRGGLPDRERLPLSLLPEGLQPSNICEEATQTPMDDLSTEANGRWKESHRR